MTRKWISSKALNFIVRHEDRVNNNNLYSAFNHINVQMALQARTNWTVENLKSSGTAAHIRLYIKNALSS